MVAAVEDSYVLRSLDRSRDLLLSHLSDRQRLDFNSFGYFDVIGGKTGRRYRIRKGLLYGRNVTWISQDGAPRISYCAYIGFARNAYHRHLHSIPEDDHILAQKLAIETDDVAFTEIACSVEHYDDGYDSRIPMHRPRPPRRGRRGRINWVLMFLFNWLWMGVSIYWAFSFARKAFF